LLIGRIGLDGVKTWIVHQPRDHRGPAVTSLASRKVIEHAGEVYALPA
jgi:hypothetical protein